MSQPGVHGVPPEVAAYRKAQEDEWGEWVATQKIYFGDALAYDIGHAVPASNVERYGYEADGLVRRRDADPGAPGASTVDVDLPAEDVAPVDIRDTETAPSAEEGPGE